MIAQIESLGLPIKRREVTDAIKAVTESVGGDDKALSCVKLADSVVFEPAAIGETLTSEQRAQTIAAKINQALDQEPQFRQIKLDSDKRTVMARGEPLIVVTDEDAALNGKPVPELAEQAAEPSGPSSGGRPFCRCIDSSECGGLTPPCISNGYCTRDARRCQATALQGAPVVWRISPTWVYLCKSTTRRCNCDQEDSLRFGSRASTGAAGSCPE